VKIVRLAECAFPGFVTFDIIARHCHHAARLSLILSFFLFIVAVLLLEFDVENWRLQRMRWENEFSNNDIIIGMGLSAA
jgi:hypothetical protein